MSGERPDLIANLIVAEAAEAEYAAAFRRILDRPEWGAACDALHRQVIVRGYPYQIVYCIMDAGAILIVAIAHCSRRPDYWVAR